MALKHRFYSVTSQYATAFVQVEIYTCKATIIENLFYCTPNILFITHIYKYILFFDTVCNIYMRENM